MADIQYLPISRIDPDFLGHLMDLEEEAWLSELSWDYSPIRRILVDYIRRRLLPGYVAVQDGEARGYIYFLIHQSKATIGSLYVSRSERDRDMAGHLLSLAVSNLKDSPNVERIEAQIMPFQGLDLSDAFESLGFDHYRRYFMELELASYRPPSRIPFSHRIIPWNPAYIPDTAEMIALSYGGRIDAVITSDYRTRAGCEGYLYSLIDNPGCGVFLPQASFLCLTEDGNPCGLILSCRISEAAIMIPQIAVHPSYQGMGIGKGLMNRSLEVLKSWGYQSVGLTVTEKNQRAMEWYRRLGYGARKEFGAYVWERRSGTSAEGSMGKQSYAPPA